MIRADLEALDGQAVDREELRTSLEEFDELWEELYSAERARMMGLLIERVEWEARAGAVAVKFRVESGTS
jgi:site-specific DNA recombinase